MLAGCNNGRQAIVDCRVLLRNLYTTMFIAPIGRHAGESENRPLLGSGANEAAVTGYRLGAADVYYSAAAADCAKAAARRLSVSRQGTRRTLVPSQRAYRAVRQFAQTFRARGRHAPAPRWRNTPAANRRHRLLAGHQHALTAPFGRPWY